MFDDKHLDLDGVNVEDVDEDFDGVFEDFDDGASDEDDFGEDFGAFEEDEAFDEGFDDDEAPGESRLFNDNPTVQLTLVSDSFEVTSAEFSKFKARGSFGSGVFGGNRFSRN